MKYLQWIFFSLITTTVIISCSAEKENKDEQEKVIAAEETEESAEEAEETLEPPYQLEDSSKMITFPSGLKLYTVEEGPGSYAQQFANVRFHYLGQLSDGTVFDNSFERGKPLVISLGKGGIIKGMEEALKKIKMGSKAIIIIPPELGYGKGGFKDSNIPPNSTLIFHVEMLGTI